MRHAQIRPNIAHFLKEHFRQLPEDVLDVYEKKARKRLAYHGFIKEAIVDTLNGVILKTPEGIYPGPYVL
jgi:hypothetical protein